MIRRQLRRAQVLSFFANLPECLIGIEACATAHYWARELGALGHQVKLIPPSYVKPYVKRQKNDAADAEAICEAVTRPTMRFVEVKSRPHMAQRGPAPTGSANSSNSPPHLMFGLAPLVIGTTARSGASLWLAEAVATFTLVLAILGSLKARPDSVPVVVGLTITAAYWFTASTSFANPAVTLERGFTTSFAGIAIEHVPLFVLAQIVGALVGLAVAGALSFNRC